MDKKVTYSARRNIGRFLWISSLLVILYIMAIVFCAAARLNEYGCDIFVMVIVTLITFVIAFVIFLLDCLSGTGWSLKAAQFFYCFSAILASITAILIMTINNYYYDIFAIAVCVANIICAVFSITDTCKLKIFDNCIDIISVGKRKRISAKAIKCIEEMSFARIKLKSLTDKTEIGLVEDVERVYTIICETAELTETDMSEQKAVEEELPQI